MAKKVLVVDDEKLIVKGIRFSLEQDGMEVDCAYDGEEALKMATENAYDMILLDIMLPKMDGFDSRLHFQNIERLCDIVICAVLQSENLIHVIALGCEHDNRHIGKLADMLAHLESVHLR